MSKNQLIVVIVVQIATVFDALRDGLLAYTFDILFTLLSNRILHTKQGLKHVYRDYFTKFKLDRWHIVKWIAFFTPLTALLWLAHMPLRVTIIMSVVDFILWRFVYMAVYLARKRKRVS